MHAPQEGRKGEEEGEMRKRGEDVGGEGRKGGEIGLAANIDWLECVMLPEQSRTWNLNRRQLYNRTR